MAILQWRRPYGVAEASIWSYDDSTETWGTVKALLNLASITITPVMDNDTMMVYGAQEHGLSVLTGADLEVQLGGLQSDADAIMTGRTVTTSGSGASEVRGRNSSGAENLPYFALGVRLRVDGDGDYHLYFPRVKLESLLPIEIGENAQFVKPSVTLKAFRLRKDAGTLYDIWYEREHATVTNIPSTFTDAIAALA